MPKKYRSDAFAAIHETMEALYEIGAIDKQTMREFDEACLTPVQPLEPEERLIATARHVYDLGFRCAQGRQLLGRLNMHKGAKRFLDQIGFVYAWGGQLKSPFV